MSQGAELDRALAALPGWRLQEGRLRRSFRFEDFRVAFGFMSAVALHAERVGHHPDWTNVYNRVDVALWTHDAGSVTLADTELAAAMDALATRFGAMEA
ncbi:MAG: hypothetical protein RIT45_3569 [Pseudomonadota bacterium]|jgi:4a-hydroxytetrahydrobiopterin dehydratase